MKISKQGLDFIKGFESFVPYVYDDLVPPVKGRYREWKGGPVKGTLTIGYGHTDTAKHPLKISQGLRITEAEACEILDVDLDECEAAVSKAVTRKLTQGQFDALVSFAFNCGNGAMRNIARRLNAGDAGAARAAFDLYTKSKGRVLRGLQRRRDGEQALWDEADPAPIAVADTFHPASVDQPEPSDTSEGASEMVDASTVEPDKSPGLVKFEIVQDLMAHSRKWLLLRWQKIIGGGTTALGLGSFIEDGKIPVWVFVAALIVLGLSMWFLASWVQSHMIKDRKAGAYVPSGVRNAGSS